MLAVCPQYCPVPSPDGMCRRRTRNTSMSKKRARTDSCHVTSGVSHTCGEKGMIQSVCIQGTGQAQTADRKAEQDDPTARNQKRQADSARLLGMFPSLHSCPLAFCSKATNRMRMQHQTSSENPLLLRWGYHHIWCSQTHRRSVGS